MDLWELKGGETYRIEWFDGVVFGTFQYLALPAGVPIYRFKIGGYTGGAGKRMHIDAGGYYFLEHDLFHSVISPLAADSMSAAVTAVKDPMIPEKDRQALFFFGRKTKQPPAESCPKCARSGRQERGSMVRGTVSCPTHGPFAGI